MIGNFHLIFEENHQNILKCFLWPVKPTQKWIWLCQGQQLDLPLLYKGIQLQCNKIE